MSETKDAVTVRAELPGLAAEDVTVSLLGTTLTLRGEKKSETKDSNETFHHAERSFGEFTRTAELPDTIDPDEASATYHEGVLTVHVGKSERSRPREIQVKVAG